MGVQILVICVIVLSGDTLIDLFAWWSASLMMPPVSLCGLMATCYGRLTRLTAVNPVFVCLLWLLHSILSFWVCSLCLSVL